MSRNLPFKRAYPHPHIPTFSGMLRLVKESPWGSWCFFPKWHYDSEATPPSHKPAVGIAVGLCAQGQGGVCMSLVMVWLYL